MNEREQAIIEKKLAIAESITVTAAKIIKASSDLPKKNIYWFKRKNIRGLSRQNRKQRAKALFDLSFSSLMGAVNIAHIVSQPIPKFKPGTL